MVICLQGFRYLPHHMKFGPNGGELHIPHMPTKEHFLWHSLETNLVKGALITSISSFALAYDSGTPIQAYLKLANYREWMAFLC